MTRRGFPWGGLILAVAAIVLLAGCTEVFVWGSAEPTGYVIQAKTGAPLPSATVYLNALAPGGDDYATTSSASGSYTFGSVAVGDYTLTAVKTGYTFTNQVVHVDSASPTLPNTGGFPTVDSLTIVAFWDRAFADVDSYLTVPTNDCGASTGALAANGSDFYTATNSPPAGFFPSATARTTVWYSNTAPFAAGTIFLDVDNTGAVGQMKGGPETITVDSFPWGHSYWGSPTYSSSGPSDPSRLPLGTYEWVGVLEYYLDAFNSVTSGTGDPASMLASTNGVTNTANPVVYVFYGSSQLARYTLPQYTDIKTASILRVNMFMDSHSAQWFQVIPDTKVYASSGSIRGLASDRGIFVVRGAAR